MASVAMQNVVNKVRGKSTTPSPVGTAPMTSPTSTGGLGTGMDIGDNAKDIFRNVADIGTNNPVYNEAIARRNEGLPPETMTALLRESTTGLTDRYESAAQGLRTDLLRRGYYGGKLPANAQQLIRSFGPLDAELANAQSKAGADARLQDFQAMLQNRQQAMQAVGAGLNSAMGAASGLGGLESTSFKNILLSSLAGAGGKLLTDPKNFAWLTKQLGGLLGIGGGAAMATGPALAASNAAAMGPGILAGAQATLPTVPLAGPAAAGIGAAGTGGAAGAAGTAATGAGAAGAGAGGGAAGGGGLMSTATALLTNPWTIAAGLGALGATIWLKSQAHHEANEIVDNIENPFWKSWGQILPTDNPAELEQLPPDQAEDIRAKLEEMNSNYMNLVTEFRKGGSDEDLVSRQSLQNTQPYMTAILNALDRAIARAGGINV